MNFVCIVVHVAYVVLRASLTGLFTFWCPVFSLSAVAFPRDRVVVPVNCGKQERQRINAVYYSKVFVCTVVHVSYVVLLACMTGLFALGCPVFSLSSVTSPRSCQLKKRDLRGA
jgi:hypothetical protein